MGHRLPMHLLCPSPQRVQLIQPTRPPVWDARPATLLVIRRRHDPRHHFLPAWLVFEQVKAKALTGRTSKMKYPPQPGLPRQLVVGIFVPCRNKDPYVPILTSVSEYAEMVHSRRSIITRNHWHLHPQKRQRLLCPLYPPSLHIPRILVRFLCPSAVFLSLIPGRIQTISRCRFPHPQPMAPPRPTSHCSCTRPHPGTPNGLTPACQSPHT
jgi:hypothetical protein